LKVNEGVVGLNVKLNVSEHCSHNVRPDFKSLRLYDDSLKTFSSLILNGQSWDGRDSKISSDGLRDTLEAQQVISVRSDFKLVYLLR